jgi:hypothetical protein
MIVLGLLLGCTASAMADITWTLSGLTFSNGNVVTGYFVTNDAVIAIDSFDIEITGPTEFTVASVNAAYLPGEIGIAGAGWADYIDLYPAGNLTSAGGTIPLTGSDAYGDLYGVDCPGCGTLSLDTTPEVIGVVQGVHVDADPVLVPELGSFETLAICLSGLVLVAFGRRRRA